MNKISTERLERLQYLRILAINYNERIEFYKKEIQRIEDEVLYKETGDD